MPVSSKRRRSDGMETVYRRNRAWGVGVTLAAVTLALALLFALWLTPIRITGESMAPALTEGEILLVDRLAKYWKIPQRGDMIMFRTQDGDFIKRIVGLPGETVDIQDGQVFIGGAPLDESAYAVNPMGSMEPVTVPAGCVFVLGDNREMIYDSRLSIVGCPSYASLYGVLRLRVSPLGRVRVFF